VNVGRSICASWRGGTGACPETGAPGTGGEERYQVGIVEAAVEILWGQLLATKKFATEHQIISQLKRKSGEYGARDQGVGCRPIVVVQPRNQAGLRWVDLG
jgi:hypothetical protein